MTPAEDHERLWEAIPEGLPPVHAGIRQRFLMDRLRTCQAHSGAGQVRALDLGCGEGHFAALLAQSGAQVVAADVAPEPLRRARERHSGLEVRLVEAHGELPFEDSSFDLVWAGEVIEHVPGTATWLSEVRRVLRSGGTLLLTTPDHGPLTMLAMALWPRRIDAHFDPRSDHVRFYTSRTLAGLLHDFGFEDVRVKRAGGLPGARAVLLASAVRKRF